MDMSFSNRTVLVFLCFSFFRGVGKGENKLHKDFPFFQWRATQSTHKVKIWMLSIWTRQNSMQSFGILAFDKTTEGQTDKLFNKKNGKKSVNSFECVLTVVLAYVSKMCTLLSCLNKKRTYFIKHAGSHLCFGFVSKWNPLSGCCKELTYENNS